MNNFYLKKTKISTFKTSCKDGGYNSHFEFPTSTNKFNWFYIEKPGLKVSIKESNKS